MKSRLMSFFLPTGRNEGQIDQAVGEARQAVETVADTVKKVAKYAIAYFKEPYAESYHTDADSISRKRGP